MNESIIKDNTSGKEVSGMNPFISSPTVEVNGKNITLSQDFAAGGR